MPNMIPCFPTSSGVDAHHCDAVSNSSSPSHFTKDILFNIPKSEPGQRQKNYATACWKITKDIIREIVMRRNAHAALYLGMINQFQELLYLRK